MRLTRTRGIRLAAVTGALAVATLGLAVPAHAGPAVDGQPTILVGSGSDTTISVMQKLDAAYSGAPGCQTIATPGNPQPYDNNCIAPAPAGSINPDHDTVNQRYPIGSGSGINQLCQQGLANVATADFARSSRGPSGSDCEGLQFSAFARDGISWFHFTQSGGVNTPSHDVSNLTQDQIRKIFVTGEINNWSQVGGDNAPIVIYAAQAGSGTRSTFDGLIGGSSSIQIPSANQATRIITENNAQPIVTNGDAANAIFYESFGRYSQQLAGNSTETAGTADALGQIDGITASAATIGSSTFPYGRSLYNVLRYPSEATKRYLDPVDGFLCRTDIGSVKDANTGHLLRSEIEAAITSEGFVPLPQGTVGGGRTGQSYCRLSVPKPDITPATVAFTLTNTTFQQSSAHVDFSEQVVGVSSSSLQIVDAGGNPVAASISCTNAAGGIVDCASGPILAANIATSSLANGGVYHVATTSGITDRGGNASAAAGSSSWQVFAPAAPSRSAQSPAGGVVKSLKKGKSAGLPSITSGGIGIQWRSLTPKTCKVNGAKVVGKKKGGCRLAAAASGNDRLLPFANTYAVKIK